jgi:hypothetical protein
MCSIWQLLFMRVFAEAANGAAIGSTLAASSYVSRTARWKGRFAEVLQEEAMKAPFCAGWKRFEFIVKTPKMEALRN